ncbi:hypothetical protein [Streptantibioticus ferralitis]|uniref:Uncharacterized protein n=1 Tax=Streptantibioticus ferralitis TaxID=236510 RepID=A0ABT5Z3X6_9ACTN|nr:hypothetical protein [Streptantibioticus ferralitis]MDF2258535.1 hypothetical protein [Streptantibioticus ferralitis]
MEQRIGPNTPPVHAAGTDPAHVPGLTFSRPVAAEEKAVEPAAEQPPGDAVPEDPAPEAVAPEEEAAAEEEAATEEGAERRADGPVFEVSDRRGSIVVGPAGVTFQLDDETAEFHWDEIGAVEIDTPRFARRFTVTVHTTGRRSYEADVEAPSRSLPKQWTTELDAVLDVYFEDTEADSPR